MFSASKSGKAVSAVTTDPQFNYVTALLHGDGTNGAQNNTFLDSSTNAFTITRTGTPTQGSFSPYGSLWSNYFDGSSALQTPNNSNLYLGSSTFTIECWVNLNYNSSGPNVIRTVNAYSFALIQGTTTLLLYLSSNGTSWDITSGSNIGSFTPNTWNHVAIVRNGSTFTCYVNGVAGATVTSASALYQTNGFYIGRETGGGYLNGYVSNARIVIGTAVYTSAFTPSTTPLTAITNTQLLTCQSNCFIDNSTNAYAITPTGTPSVQRFNPFLPTSSQAYSTSVYGGSGYFNGSSDYLVSGSTTAFNAYCTGSATGITFTVEAFVYPTATVAGASVWQSAPIFVKGVTYFNFGIYNNKLRFYWYDGSNKYYDSTASVPLYAWTQVSGTVNGSTITLYINGVSSGTGTFTGIQTGAQNGAENFAYQAASATYFPGYISSIRLSNNVRSIAVQTAPLTSDANTIYLINCQNAGIYDNAMMNDWITVGSAQISTSVKKYGTGSVSFNGSTDQLTSNAPNTNLYAFGTNDFTIEMWFYVAGGATANTNLYDSTPSGGGVVALQIYIIGSPWTIRLYGGSAGALLDSNFTVSTSTWYHLAICRASGSTKIFVNGAQQGSTYSDSNNYTNGSQRPVIGAWGSGSGNYFNGYIDDLRVTKGYARYTANFTPPTAALPNYGR